MGEGSPQNAANCAQDAHATVFDIKPQPSNISPSRRF